MNNGISYKTTLKNKKMDEWFAEETEDETESPKAKA
ncbi:MAG: hypothetical protein QS98_C0012G0019 [archaeon GW2011_AR3]|nr:MAG: hypothetical protein QS98_C0012G0019 [archaeon GW2011_AR3]